MSDIVNDNEQATHPYTQPLPEDVLRIVLEAAVEPEDSTFGSLADNRRLSVGYKLCLVNKSAARWIEPLLYELVSLESERQVVSFSYTLKNKDPTVLSQRVRALWLFEEGPSVNRIDFRHLFATLRGLENVVLVGYWHSVLPLAATRSSIRDLILVEPQGSYELTSLRQLSLRSLLIIDAAVGFFSSPTSWHVNGDATEAFVKREILRAQLEAIPRICLDFTQIPPYHPTHFVPKLTDILKEAERFRLHEQSRSPPSLVPDDKVESKGLSDSRSLWIKTNPIQRNVRPSDSELASETLASTWDNILAEYKQNGPLHRPVCGHSLWGDEAELIRIRRLPWMQRMKESIRYNELHWDRVARWCATEGAKEIRARSRTD